MAGKNGKLAYDCRCLLARIEVILVTGFSFGNLLQIMIFTGSTPIQREVPEMTKADLAEIIYERLTCQKKEAVELVDLVMGILKEAIATEGHVKISGFGNFMVRQKADRNGRNPQTGETITISSRKVLTFKPSTILKSRINQGS